MAELLLVTVLPYMALESMDSNGGRFRGSWQHGLSYSKNDVAVCGTAFYKAKSDRPCYDDPPSLNPEWEGLHDCQSKNNKAKER